MDNFLINLETESDHIYVCLDTAEGTDCFGHWMYECALFLPYLKIVSEEFKKPLRIILHSNKRYKRVVLSDFGFKEDSIVFSNRLTTTGHYWQMNHVIPIESCSYIVPKFLYTWPVTTNTLPFFEHVNKFIEYYDSPVIKTIPYLFLKRSEKENYAKNSRKFLNLHETVSCLRDNNVQILDVDTLDSLRPQIQLVRSAKVLIMEMGSAFTINAGWFAKDCHVIILNDFFNANTCQYTFMDVIRKQMKSNNVTFEILTHQPVYNADFSIPLERLLQRIQMERQSCVVCGSCEFQMIAEFPTFPIMAVSNDSVPSYFTKCVMVCKKCQCLQLKNLVDPKILYSSAYMNAAFSPAWSDHHNSFCDFIIKNTDVARFLEIGANKGTLYSLLKQKRNIEYFTLDMYRDKDLPEEVKLCIGDCESYNYSGVNSVIASHVFEHLYNPHRFVEEMMKGGVKEVFIAIPNFRYLLESKSLQTIHSQHTFYCDKDFIKYIFSKHGYSCEYMHIYDGSVKSYFLKFILNGCEPVEIPTTEISLFESLYVDKVAALRHLNLPEKTYIMPSGIYGQFLYYFLGNKKHVFGFLDNNMSRHGKLLYGTDKRVLHPSQIDMTDITIAICNCPYKEEIISELQTKYPSVKLLLLDQ